MNKAILLGRLTRDPELRYTPNGIAVANFDLAVNRSTKRPDGSNDVDFLPVIAWRERAEFVANYLSKGRQVLVEGRIKTRSYTDRTGLNEATEIEATAIYLNSKKGNRNRRSDYLTPETLNRYMTMMIYHFREEETKCFITNWQNSKKS